MAQTGLFGNYNKSNDQEAYIDISDAKITVCTKSNYENPLLNPQHYKGNSRQRRKARRKSNREVKYWSNYLRVKITDYANNALFGNWPNDVVGSLITYDDLLEAKKLLDNPSRKQNFINEDWMYKQEPSPTYDDISKAKRLFDKSIYYSESAIP